MLAAVALEVGQTAPFFDALARPGEGVPLPGQNVEVVYAVRTTHAGGKARHQPVYVLRVTKLVPPRPAQGAGGP